MSTSQLGRTSLVRIALACAIAAPAFVHATPVFAAVGDVGPNTVISNTATATYSDGNNNPYSTTSNTVTTTVQNAPSLTVTPTPGVIYAPGQTATDTFTLTNTGNAAGTFTIASPLAIGGTESATATATQYTVTLPGGTAQVFTSITAANAYLLANPVAVGASATFTQTYVVPTNASTATATDTYATTPSVTITQPVAGAAAAVTSTPVNNQTVTDTIDPDAVLDIQKADALTTAAGAVPASISYSLAIGDGSLNFKAKDLASAGALLGLTSRGVLVTDKLPVFNGVPLAMTVAPTFTNVVANGYLGGTETTYYTTNATGASGWTALAAGALAPAGATYVGFYFTGGTGGYEFGPDATSQASLSVDGTVPNPATTVTFSIAQPTGNGAANANVTNLANGAIGSNATTETILAPGIPAGTADSASTTALTTGTTGVDNVTPTTGTAPVNEASNQVAITPTPVAGVFNGPLGAPQATGSYDGVVATNATDDYMNGVLTGTTNASTNSGTVPGTPTGSADGVTTTATVGNSLQNTGNADESYKLTFAVPTGVTVTAVYLRNADGSNGAPFTGSAAAGFTTPANVPSGGTINYNVVYAGATSVPTLTREDVAITATGVTSADTNVTHDELYAGFIALTKSQAIVTNCPVATGGTNPVCPGGTITYTIDYRNIAPAVTGTEPAAATAATTVPSGKLVITEDGAAGTNTWAADTNGLNAAPVDSVEGAATTYAYSKGGTAQGTAPAATAFVATVGVALPPATHSTIAFAVTVK